MDRSFTGAGSVAMDGYTREGGLLGHVTNSCRNAYPNSLGGMDICYLTGESATTRAPDSIRYCLQHLRRVQHSDQGLTVYQLLVSMVVVLIAGSLLMAYANHQKPHQQSRSTAALLHVG